MEGTFMRAELAAAVVVVAACVGGVRYWEARSSAEMPNEPPALAAATPAPASPYSSSGWGKEVRIAASRDHQFYVDAAVNNTTSSFLVDTGASYVALRDSDARLAGVHTSWVDFDKPVRTANGETKAALVTLDAIEIDGLRVEDVQAFILPDDQLAVNLLGMSFLSRLESVEARSGELILKG
jgi:aspartyl protease family protein